MMAEAEAGKFEFPDIGVFDTLDYAELEFVCDAGESMVFETMSCGKCIYRLPSLKKILPI